MAAEHLPSDSRDSVPVPYQPDMTPPFEVPAYSAPTSEKKTRKRRKKRGHSAEAVVSPGADNAPSQSHDHNDDSQPIESEGTMWRRDEATSSWLGSQAFAAAEKAAKPDNDNVDKSSPAHETAADEGSQATEQPSQPASEAVHDTAVQAAAHERPDETDKPEEATTSAADQVETEAAPQSPSAEAPIDMPVTDAQAAEAVGDFPPQPEHQQQQAPDQPAVAPQPELHPEHQPEHPATEMPYRPTPFEQSYETPPPMPPDLYSHRRRFWEEQPAAVDGAEMPRTDIGLPSLHDPEVRLQAAGYQPEDYMAQPAHHEYEPSAVVPGPNKYESPLPPGLQRSPADVSRAAWVGLLTGRWWGRRGKDKAVKSAYKAGRAEGAAVASRRLEAEPIHNYPVQELSRNAVQPISVETRPLARSEAPPVRRAPETVAVPVAAVAVLERALRQEHREIPRAARVAGNKVTERVVARMPEAAAGARAERHLGKRELMRVAKDIKIDNVRLKDIFSAKRIDEVGLRSVVDTYLRGGDIRQQLTREIVKKEQSYERDPQLRHTRQQERDERRSAKQSKPAGVLGQAGGVVTSQGGKLASSAQKTAKSAGQAIAASAKQAQHDIIDNSNTSDWLSITAVVVLWSIILVLWLG
jgi:hypothetical protein